MHARKVSKTVLATAVAAVALGATPLANAGIIAPGKHPDGVGVPQKLHGIGVPQKHPDGIGVPGTRQHGIRIPGSIRVPGQNGNIIAVFKHPDRVRSAQS